MDDLFAKGTMPALRSIGFIKAAKGETFQSLYHHHPNAVEMLLIAKGSAAVTVGNRTLEAGPHSLIVFHEGVWHQERSDPASPHTMLYFAMEGLHIRGLAPGLFLEESMPFAVPLGGAYFSVERQFYELMKEYHEIAPRDPLVIRYRFAALLAELSRIVHKRPQPKRNKSAQSVTAAVEYIHEHYSEAIPLEKLARIALLSPYHFTRIFKEETGRTPIQYLIAYRLEAAKQFLRNTQEPVEVVAELVGYESHTHFQQAFKKAVGVTPGKFRAGFADAATGEKPL